jgi:hypothetical protein
MFGQLVDSLEPSRKDMIIGPGHQLLGLALVQELHHLEQEGAAAEAAELRHRYEAIEEELLARIEGYRPV